MSVKLRNLEWLNHNTQRAYPVSAAATGLDSGGVFTIPNDFIVGMSLPVHCGLDVVPSQFYIKRIANYSTGFAITIGYFGDSSVDVASALIARSTHTENQSYGLGGLGDFADSRGHIMIGSLAGIDDQPAGLFEFDLAGGLLEPEVIRPHIRGVMSIRLQNGSELSDSLYGYVRIIAGRRIRFRTTIAEGEDPIVIVDAIDGEGLIDDCLCGDSTEPIRTINGVSPDGNGNLQLVGNDCIEISSEGNGLVLTDLCSEPCCGCKELEAITSALEAFGDKATTLENFLVSLEARVTEMDMSVLGSRLGDRGCEQDC